MSSKSRARRPDPLPVRGREVPTDSGFFRSPAASGAVVPIDWGFIRTLEGEPHLDAFDASARMRLVANICRRFRQDAFVDFSALPPPAQTAIVSVLMQYHTPDRIPVFWGYVTWGDWSSAAAELRGLVDGYPRRRAAEADLLEQLCRVRQR